MKNYKLFNPIGWRQTILSEFIFMAIIGPILYNLFFMRSILGAFLSPEMLIITDFFSWLLGGFLCIIILTKIEQWKMEKKK